MKKLHLIIDFDNTLVNSHKALYLAYQEITGDYSSNYDETSLNWLVSDLCPTFNQFEIDNIFSTNEFFDKLYIYDNVIEVLKYFKKLGHTIEICSLHKLEGINKKRKWIEEKFPFVDKVTIIPFNQSMSFDKSAIQGDVIIDDNLDCLYSSECRDKICYCNNNTYNWNKDWKGIIATDWKQIEQIIQCLTFLRKDL